MSGTAEDFKTRLLAWLETAVDEGWIHQEELTLLESLQSHGPEALFQTGPDRPLTVGLFGGTGVGKSSLLNRLIGEPVAEVGLERPTSKGVVVYVHEQYPVGSLEGLLPVDRVRVVSHGREEYADIAWVDMPDIDSVEIANRELVFEWLPYIDWLIYVASPERYRDDAGWRVLAERGHRHHWLFVMNRWDTATESQFDDFTKLLAEEGFGDARVLRTSCNGGPEDDFEQIPAGINDQLAEQGNRQLQEVGERAVLQDLHRHCERYSELLGGEARWRAFADHGSAALSEKLDGLIAYLRDEASIEAARIPDHGKGDAVVSVHEPPRPRLMDEYVQDLDSVVAVSLDGLPAKPATMRTAGLIEPLGDDLYDAVRQGFREGIARPGNVVQRKLETLMRKLVYGLPLVVSLVVAYLVLGRYRAGLSEAGVFLGFDFLAHSLMILGLAVLGPYLLARLLRPSVRRSIVKRVGSGLDRVHSGFIQDWRAAMQETHQRSRELRRGLETVRDDMEQWLR